MRKSFLALAAILALPAAAQSQPGRILVDNTGPSILEFNIDGSNGFAIAGNTDNNVVFSPSVAGDGTIAFTAYYDVDGTYLGHPCLFLMNADGTNVRKITSALPGSSSNCCYSLSPVVSPDGTTVAFLAAINAAPNGIPQQEVYLVNADGSNLRQLTPFMANPGGDYTQSYMDGFAWSPDSSTLAFRGTVYTSQCGTYGGDPIFVSVVGSIKADGTNMQYLACDNGDGYVTSIDWSPDGTLLGWGRNVRNGAQGCSGCVGEPAIAFYDFTGQNRYSNGITSGALGTDSCQGGPHCIHFSPDNTQLAYVDAYPGNGNPCQSSCNVSLINLDGSGQTNTTIPSGGHTVWWMPGTAIPAPAQLTVAGPNGPAATIEVWPGFSQQVTPTLSDSNGNLILHTAQNYLMTHYFYGGSCLTVGPYGLAEYLNGGNGNTGNGTIYATNAGQTSNTLTYNCFTSPPCTFTLGSTYTEIPGSGGTGMVSVTADPGSSGSTCPWSATPSASWIMITSGANGSGNGSVNFSVTANSGAARQATITIAGQTYTVSQDAPGTGTPTITFGPAPTPNYLGGNFTVSATTNSDGALSYSYVSGPCAQVSGGTFSLSGAGTCVIKASTAATTNFTAGSATQNVTIAPATPTITFGPAPTPNYLGGNFTVSATTNSDGALSYSYMSGPCAQVSGGIFSSSGAGSCMIKASIATTINFTAGSTTQSVTIAPATPTITFGPAPTPTYPGANFIVSATTNSNGTLSYSYASGPCAQVSGGTFNSSGAGTCVIRASTAATTNFTAGSTTQNVTIVAAAPSVPRSGTSCNGTYNGTFNGNVTVSAGQTCTFVGGGITGNVQVNNAGLILSHSTVTGNVQIAGGNFQIGPSTTIKGNLNVSNLPAGPGADMVCGAQVQGNAAFTGNAAGLEIGSSTPACLGNTIGGNLNVSNNSGAAQVIDNAVGGNMTVGSNLGQTQVMGNAVTGALQCQSNSALIVSGPNPGSNHILGQCH